VNVRPAQIGQIWLALARAGGVPAPAVIAARADDTAALLLIEYVDGSSYQPAVPDPAA
jgi:hypothetical protein